MTRNLFLFPITYPILEPQMKTKKAFITIRLVKEAEKKSNKEIEKEIFESLSKGLPRIPWLAEVEKVTVREG